MTLSRSRLDKFVSDTLAIKRKDVRLILAQKRVKVDDVIVSDCDFIIDKFSKISIDDKLVQNNPAYYVMLHKPIGVVCATTDKIHKTVIDLLDFPFKHQLHIVGRLDLNTSGLVLLTNDSRWSERLMLPESKVSKQYIVTLEKTVEPKAVEVFAQGIYFEYEDITTKPAKLEIIEENVVKLELKEGKYHQIKRMFGRFRNKVLKLHRTSIGNLELDSSLKLGEARELTAQEVIAIF